MSPSLLMKISILTITTVSLFGLGEAFCCRKRATAADGETVEVACPADHPFARSPERSCEPQGFASCAVSPGRFMVSSGSVTGLCCQYEGPRLGTSFIPECDEEPPPSTVEPTVAPTMAPTSNELTAGTSFTFNSYVKESDLFFDDTYVHQTFSITVKCDREGKAVNGGTTGPTTVVNEVDSAEVDGPWVNVINNKELQVDWEGGAVEEDAPGWTITATGAGLCFTPAAKVGVCLVVAGLATEVFDDEILWGYRRSVTFSCVPDGNSWKVEMVEAARPVTEAFKTNDSEFYTEYD